MGRYLEFAKHVLKEEPRNSERSGGAEIDPYGERVRAALREINRPDYPAGMIPWLGDNMPDLYKRLTSELPDEVNRLWNEHVTISKFEAVLRELIEAHQQACALYRNWKLTNSVGNMSEKDFGTHLGIEEDVVNTNGQG
jgi:hypothetical protein